MGKSKISLVEAIYDNPKTQEKLAVCEEDAQLLRKFTQEFLNQCNKIQKAQQELAEATRGLSTVMKKYKDMKFPMERKESCMMTTFPLLADYVEEISRMQEAVASQISGAMISPISRFVSADLEELSQLQNLYRLISDEHELSVQRYCRLSQRCGEPERCTAIDEVFHMRKKLHRTALHYFSSMNMVQRKRQFVFLESLASHLQAHLALFKAGGDYADRQELDSLHGTTKGLLLCGQRELDLERASSASAVASLEAAYDESAFLPEPLNPSPQPETQQSTRKSGYLMQRCRPGPPGVASRWDRLHFSVRRGCLMRQTRRPLPTTSTVLGVPVSGGVCLLDLRKPVAAAAAPADADDRRHVFVVTSHGTVGSSPLFLQAESSGERANWIAVINAAAATAADEDESSEDVSDASDCGSQDEEAGEDDEAEDAGLGRRCMDEPLLLSSSDRSVALLSEDARSVAGAAFSRVFFVRMIGSCLVEVPEADTSVAATASAAADAVLRTAVTGGGERLLLAVSDQGVWLVEPAGRLTRCRLSLSRARFWPASRRLIGLSASSEPPHREPGRRRPLRFECLALRLGDGQEGDEESAIGQQTGMATTETVCAALSTAMRSAADLTHDSRETALLLANIDRLPDADVVEPGPLTPPSRRDGPMNASELNGNCASGDDEESGGEAEGGESMA